jgi:hypothetical protein
MSYVAKSALGLLTAALLCGVAPYAMAQEADVDLRLETDTAVVDAESDVPVNVRPRTPRITIGDDAEPVVARRRRVVENPYAAQGLPAGAFRLFPSIELGTVVASNVRRTPTDAKADVGLRLKPQLRFESDWVRHSLTGTFNFEGQRFLDDSDIKSLAGSAQAALRLDIRHATRADFDTSYTATSTGLESNKLPLTATGSRLDQTFGFNAGITQDLGGIEGRLRLGLSRSIFGDVDLLGGGSENNEDRNYTQLTVAARVGLKTGTLLQPYGEVAYVPRIHDTRKDRFGIERNSQGLRLSVGTTIDDAPIWNGDVAATLELRDYSDESLATVLVPGLAASMTWQPTDLTKFEFNATASLAETVAAGVSATKNWTFGGTATHALRDNLDLVAGLRGDFERAGGDTNVTTVGSFGVNWTLNPMVVLSAGYEGTFFNGAAAGGDYADHRLLTSIILRR